MLRTFGIIAVAGMAVASTNAGAQSPPNGATRMELSSRIVRDLKIEDVSKFVPAVAALDSGGRCGPPMSSATGVGHVRYRLSFGDKPESLRNVSVTVDSLNNLQHYSDLRGDLRAPFSKNVSEANPLGPRTTISLNAVQGLGTLVNEQTEQSNEPITVKGTDFLNAPNLGTPIKMIERILSECRKP